MSVTTGIPAPAVTAAPSPEAEARAAFVAAWHEIGAVLETHPEVPLPFDGRLDPVTFHFLAGTDPAAAMNAAAAVIGCQWTEGTSDYRQTGGGVYRDLRGELNGLKLRLTARHDDGPGDEAGPDAETPGDGETETEAA